MKHGFLLALLLTAAHTHAADDTGWFNFNPPPDAFRESAIDLRFLNEKFAGEHGIITASGDGFVHSANRESVRFWAVNGPPSSLTGDALNQCARRLAKYGVNLVRMHGAMFDKTGAADLKKVSRTQAAVAALKAEGIY